MIIIRIGNSALENDGFELELDWRVPHIYLRIGKRDWYVGNPY